MSKHPLYNETGLSRNNQPQVLYSLVNKRAEIDGKIIELKKELFSLEMDLLTIDRSINIFNPDLNIEIKPKIPKKDNINFPFKRAKIEIFKILRSSSKALSTDFIHEALSRELGVDISHKHTQYAFKNKIGNILVKLHKDKYLDKEKSFNKTYYKINKDSSNILLDNNLI